jgi:polysaccharide biosynthesis/export protein
MLNSHLYTKIRKSLTPAIYGRWLALCLLCYALIFSACQSHKELINFRRGKKQKPNLATLAKQNISNLTDLKLQPNDVLGIVVNTPDNGGLLSSPYNLVTPQLSGQMFSSLSPATFILNNEGYIDVPSIGRIKAGGMTIKELREEIQRLVAKDIVNPSVNVRLMNFKVSVLGEVLHPGIIPIEGERITILEALAKVGDLTPYANRRHIIVIREKDGIREFGEIDLKSTNIFTSPYYYLQQNDVIYIEPLKGKIAQIQQPINTYLSPAIASLSIILTTISLIIQATK